MTKLTDEQVKFIKDIWLKRFSEIMQGTTVTNKDLLKIWLELLIEETKEIKADSPKILEKKKAKLNQLKEIQERIN